MARSISWRQTGGKTHVVTVVEDVPAHPWEMFLNAKLGNLGAEQHRPDEAFLAWQAEAMRQAQIPVVGGGIFGGLFSALLICCVVAGCAPQPAPPPGCPQGGFGCGPFGGK
jgi:hypothetical protein